MLNRHAEDSGDEISDEAGDELNNGGASVGFGSVVDGDGSGVMGRK